MATGRKTVVVGQVIDPVAWGNPLWDQSVQQFASDADRTTQFPTAQRKLGAVTWLDDVKRLEVWDGTAWVRLDGGVPSFTSSSIVAYGPSSNTAPLTLGGPFSFVPPRSGLARATAKLDYSVSATAGFAGAAVSVAGTAHDAEYLFPGAAGGNRAMVNPTSAFRVVQGVAVSLAIVAWVFNAAGSWTINAGVSHWYVEVS